MFCYINYIKLVLFLFPIISFGLISLSQITKIRTLILLIPFSITFGIAYYICLCHILSFLVGPQLSSVLSLLVLLFLSGTIIFLKRKDFIKPINELSKNQNKCLFITSGVIWLLTFLTISKFGTFDKEFHIPVALSIFHNNIYPPKDFYRPEYVLLYHYGGDLLAGAINYLCNINILECYEINSTIFSGTTFLSFFALAWLISKHFKTSFLCAFCTYFGGGVLWLDAIIRYILNLLPESFYKWGFIQTFLNIGIYGGIINAPSVSTFLSTCGFGNPLLIFSFVLLWNLINEKSFKSQIVYLCFLNISLFTLFITAEWLYMTFWAGVIPYLLILFIRKKQNFSVVFILLITSIALNKSIGSALFMQDPIQHLGRANIFNIGIKEKLFWVTRWGRLDDIMMHYKEIPCLSWEFISEFGFSLILCPLIVFYLIRTKNKFAFLLFLCVFATMPLPTILDFRINPVDANRLFSFGNYILILLITISISTLFKSFFQKKYFTLIYILGFCLSPISGLVLGSVFSPYIYTNKVFVKQVFNILQDTKSISGLFSGLKNIDSILYDYKLGPETKYKNEIEFLSAHSSPQDVAISSYTDIPLYVGIYTIVPANKWIFKDLLYSSFDSIYLTTLTTLDPYLLNELNVKWLILSKRATNNLPIETQNKLADSKLFKLAYSKLDSDPKQFLEIYKIEDLSKILNGYKRSTAWFLANSKGQPLEISLNSNKISLFPSSYNALSYLNELTKLNPGLRNKLITSQTIEISKIEEQIRKSMLNIRLEVQN